MQKRDFFCVLHSLVTSYLLAVLEITGIQSPRYNLNPPIHRVMTFYSFVRGTCSYSILQYDMFAFPFFSETTDLVQMKFYIDLRNLQIWIEPQLTVFEMKNLDDLVRILRDFDTHGPFWTSGLSKGVFSNRPCLSVRL